MEKTGNKCELCGNIHNLKQVVVNFRGDKEFLCGNCRFWNDRSVSTSETTKAVAVTVHSED